MMKYFVHYRPDDGAIIGYGNSFEPKAIEGYAIAIFDEPFDVPDPHVHKIAAGQIVDMTGAERRRARAPKRYEVDQVVYAELCRTDHLLIYDRPTPNALREALVEYRHALRELSKLGEPAAMVRAWPVAPDGGDPIIDLRERLKA